MEIFKKVEMDDAMYVSAFGNAIKKKKRPVSCQKISVPHFIFAKATAILGGILFNVLPF